MPDTTTKFVISVICGAIIGYALGFLYEGLLSIVIQNSFILDSTKYILEIITIIIIATRIMNRLDKN